jgi:glycosyltransferase involved in cell wall biosynthesis
MPLFNKAEYVADAIRSIQQQSVVACEVIVVDDGSTDGSTEIVESIAYPRIRLIRQANSGVSVARNRGIEEAKGEYIAFLDADDCYQPGFLAGISRLITEYPQAGMYCTAFTSFWPDGTRQDRRLKSAAPDAALLVRDFYKAWSRSTFTFTSAIAVKCSVLSDLALHFPTGEKLGEDQDVWFRLAERTPIAYLNSPLVDYRMAVQGSATQASLVTEMLPCFVRLDDRIESGKVPSHLRSGARRLIASHLLNIARTHLSLGNLDEARKYLSDRRARSNPIYFLRTALALFGGSIRDRVRA